MANVCEDDFPRDVKEANARLNRRRHNRTCWKRWIYLYALSMTISRVVAVKRRCKFRLLRRLEAAIAKAKGETPCT